MDEGLVRRCLAVFLLLICSCCVGLQYDSLENYSNDDGCALILNSPGRTSAYDYTYNLLRGSQTPTGSQMCITYEAINRAYYKARKRINVAQPHTEIWKPEELATVGELLLDISTTLAQIYGLTREEVERGLPQIDTSKTLIHEVCPGFVSNVECRPGKYRRFDGLCTNLENPTWGAALSPFARLMPPAFADGMTAPRISVTGDDLPLSRVVSRTMHPDDGFHDHAGTVMVIAWGQFMDHDYTLTATPLDPMNRNDPEECCSKPPHLKNPYCNEIKIPDDDYFYRLFNVKCMDFVRAFPAVRPGCRLGSRVPFNLLTGVLDGNTVYGIREEFARKLRSGYAGQLRMNPVFSEYGLKDLLPLKLDIPDEGCTRPNKSMYCFEAGEIRVNEQLVLTCMHTLMAREHNRIAKGLAQVNPHWDDEMLFQESRRIIIAEIQHVTYNEFLPILLGKDVMAKFGLLLEKHNYWDGYDPSVNPGVIDAFAAAAFRFGHSLLPTAVERWSKAHKFIASKRLSDLIRRPYDLYRAGVLDEYFMGLMNQVAQAMDDSITQEVTNHLFKKVGARHGMDLVSFNMQRGREFGVPSYMEFRKLCGLPEAHNFEELFGTMSNETIRRYSSIFTHPADVDLWSGGVSERPLPGSMLGPTFACIIATQFSNSRRGDRFWYELPNQPSSFTLDQLNEIRKTKLARLICDNTDLIDTIQVYPMVLPDHEINPRVPCKSGVLPSIDFSKWAEYPAASHAAQYRRRVRTPWTRPYVLIKPHGLPMKLKDLVLSASSPPKSINEGLFFPEPSENPVTASWKFSEVFKPKYLKPKIPPRFKRSADLPAPDKLPNYPLSESRIEKRYSNLELVGVKPEVLYRHPGLSVEEQSKPQKKIAISSESFRRTPPGVNEPIVLPLPSKPLSYTTIIGNCNGTSSEVSDLNLSINSNRFLGRIVIPDPDPFLVGSEPYKLPEETKQANRTYVNLQDHQAVISSPPDQGNHSDILPYNPDDIPYVEVPDYTDRREESLDDNNNENMKDKYSNVDNDAVDPGTLPNEEGEKSSPFVGSESERTKEEDFTVKKIANDSGETSQVGNQHGKSRKDSEVVRRSEERPIKNSRPDEKSEEFSNAKINPKNITGSAEAELEPVSLDVEDFVKPFDLDKFINELFHRNHKTNTEESKAEASRKELTDDSEEEEFNHWRYSDYYGPHNDGTNEDESKDYFESHESQNEPYANPDDFLRKHFTGDVIHKFKKSDLKTDEKPTNSHSVTGFLSKLPIRVKNYEPKGQERKNNRPKYQKQWVLEYGFPSRTDKTNA